LAALAFFAFFFALVAAAALRDWADDGHQPDPRPDAGPTVVGAAATRRKDEWILAGHRQARGRSHPGYATLIRPKEPV